MPVKRANSFAEEEALITRPSSRQAKNAPRGYELEDSSVDHEAESQSLLTSTTLVDGHHTTKGGKLYRDADDDGERYFIEETNISSSRGRRISPGSAQRRRRRTMWIAAIIAGILLGGLLSRPLLYWSRLPGAEFMDDPQALMTNGTHDYKKTVLLVSIDGLRADYLDRGLTPHLLGVSKRGLRARWMKPAFPSLTFPNHWTLMTGLHPESHGIVGNNFYDPKFDAEFVYTDPRRSHAGKWWGGEPMWETARKAGLSTANMMWPGPPTTSRGISPTYFVDFNDDTKMFEKVAKIVEWLELPIERRPRLITVYEPSLDEAAHLSGPESSLVRTVLEQVDVFAKDIHQSLTDRNLTHIVDLIFVSDHGMTDTSAQRIVYLDEIIGEDGVNEIVYEDGWPNFGLRFGPNTNASHYLSLLKDYSAAHQPNSPFEVYTHETMPKRFHFSNNERIAPIYICPRLGWIVSNHHEVTVKWGGGTTTPKGTHGYDNDEPDMRAMFVADGSFAKRANSKLRARASSDVDPATRVIPGFPNLELYNLVTKLLGLTPAPNNGTEGFWDQYL